MTIFGQNVTCCSQNKGVRVNSITPGRVAVEKVLLGHSGERSEIAKLVVFPCSEDAGHSIGQSVIPDGGTTLFMSPISDFRTKTTATFDTGYVPGI